MAAVRRWLESRNVYSQNDWLDACISFVKEDNEGTHLSPGQLNELVYEQWLMAEIQESSRPCLPEGLGNRDICKLEGTFNLQINSTLNVGESAYSQIQKLKGQDDPQELNYKANPSEPKIKPSRMLLLELTDGAQTVFGMEYQLIPSLKINTPPGTKIQVNGHITCRLGALLLRPSNVKILGGSVMHLMEENSYWNILHQAIGQDPPVKPDVIKTEAITSEEQAVNQITIQDNSATNIISQNERTAMVKTETNQRNLHAVGLSNNNNKNNNSHLGNTVYVQDHRGQLKQQVPRGPKGVQSNFPKNYSRDHKQFGNGSKMENVCSEEFFDDDDELLAAVAEDDYFAMDEDFDMNMEQIDQLEKGMLITATTTANKPVTNSNMISSEEQNFEMPYDDEIFDDEIFDNDFVEEDILAAEVTESVEMRPLHQRISNAGTIEQMHLTKKARTSRGSSTEFSSHVKKSSTSNTSSNSIPRKSDVSTRRPRIETFTVNNIKREPISEMNNSTYPCNAFTKPELGNKSRNAGALKLFSNKINATNSTNNYLSSSKPSFPSSPGIQIKKEPDVEVGPSCVNSSNQCINTLVQGTCQKMTDQECNSVPFEYLSEVLKHVPVNEKCTVRVKAYIATLLSRPDPMSSQWNITVKLNDGTGAVDALLSEKVLAELLEYPVDKYKLEIQEAMRSRNPALCQRLYKRTQQFQRNLASTSGLMDLQFSPDTPIPRVLRLTQPTSRDVSEMIRRVRESF